MAKMYVLMEVGWEYNDEYCFRVDARTGSPKKVFEDKDKAQEACDKLNADEVRKLVKDGSIIEYGCDYNYTDLVKHSAKTDMLFKKILGVSFKDWSNEPRAIANFEYENEEGNTVVKNLTNEELDQIADCFKVKFWEVVAVEKGD